MTIKDSGLALYRYGKEDALQIKLPIQAAEIVNRVYPTGVDIGLLSENERELYCDTMTLLARYVEFMGRSHPRPFLGHIPLTRISNITADIITQPASTTF